MNTTENSWDVVEFRHEDYNGFVSSWYSNFANDDMAAKHALDPDFPFYSAIKLRNGQIIRVKPKGNKS